MRKASAPTLFLVGLLVLAAVAAVTFGVGTVAGLGDDESVVDEGPEVVVPPTPTSDPTLAATESTVTGVASVIGIEGAVLAEDVLAPEVVTPSAGLGAGARFEGVVVDGEPASISWDAGRPLTMAGATPLRLGHSVPFNLFATPAGVTFGFVDGQAYPVVPGDYEIDAPVALTTTGLGRARDSVAFTAGDATTVAFTGGASTSVGLGPLSITGPGRVTLQGDFELRRADGSVQRATTIDLPQGAFRLTLTPTTDGTGFTLSDVLLAGEVTAS